MQTARRYALLSAAACLALPRIVGAQTCPETDFETFLASFAADPALQQQYSRDPLPVSRIDMDADPEPAKVHEEIAHENMHWPAILDVNDQERMTTMIASPDEDSRVVFVRGINNGILSTYYFRAEPCWTLVRVDSDST